MSRSKSWIAVIAIALVAAALVAASLPQKVEAAGLKAKLRTAKRALRHSAKRLTTAQAALAAAVAAESVAAIDPLVEPVPTATPTADGTPTPDATPAADVTPVPTATPTEAAAPVATSAILTVEELQARVAKARRAVRIWQRRVRRLERQYRFRLRMAEWERRGEWMPIIRVAASRYHVSAEGMYRMMMRESGGRRFAGSSSPYKGLFQYWTGTWAASWNPWRHDSIYDGSSQIFATAYAISRGMGPQMWTTTFAALY